MDFLTFHQQMQEHYYRAYCYHTMNDPDQDATSGNHAVLNATFHLISKKLGGYNDQVVLSQDFIKEKKFADSCRVESGLFNRHPAKAADQQTHDDNLALVVSGKILGLPFGKEIEDYAEKHWHYFDNLRGPWNIANWQGRFTWLTAIFKRGAGKEINWFDRLSYCGYLLNTAYLNKDPTDTSGRILQWLSIEVMRGEGKAIDWAIGKWEEKIKELYPDQMGGVLGIYHKSDHPFAQAMRGRI